MNPFRNQVLHKLTSPLSPCITIYSTSLHKPRELLTSHAWVAYSRVSCSQAAWVAYKLRERLTSCVSDSEAAWVAQKLREWLTSCLSGLQATWVAHKLRECLTSCVSGSKLREWLTSCVSSSLAVVYKNITSCLCACVCVCPIIR